MADPSLYPFTFHPILKERVWGGRRLEYLYGKRLPASGPVGESWEISDRPGDVSVIANGVFAGRDLQWLIQAHGPQVLGRTPLYNGRFPLLIKILDATEKLSLQVHPPPEKAGELGGEPKTELWYIAEASPGAELYVGLRKGCTRQEFARKIQAGTVADCFHRVPVKAGDAMFLPSGRVHAIGSGLVIFEIQQNSDTTYRVFDWNRVGLDGKPRELHVRQSMESIDFTDFEPKVLRPEPLPGAEPASSLLRHNLFSVDLAVSTAGESFPLRDGTMQIVGIVSGDWKIQGAEHDVRLSAGQFCLIPASLHNQVMVVDQAGVCLCARVEA